MTQDASKVHAASDLAQRGRRVHYPAGRTIFHEGDAGSELLLILTGQVEVSRITAAGRKSVLAHLGTGDTVGELALLDQGPRSASATAVSDVTGRLIGFADFRAFLFETPEAHLALTREVCQKLRAANQILEDMTLKDGAARLVRTVLRLIEKFDAEGGKGPPPQLKLSQGELGERAGLSRSNVNRYLQAWSKAGLIQFADATLTVLDLPGLQRIVEDE